MKRPRPYIPIAVRLKVALQQCEQNGLNLSFLAHNPTWPRAQLNEALTRLFGIERFHLDHDPPLRLRKFNKRTGLYTPDANDADYLFYRTAEDHRVKTLIHGEHGQYSDRVLIKRAKRHEYPIKEYTTPGFVVTKKRDWRWPKRKLRRQNVQQRGKGQRSRA